MRRTARFTATLLLWAASAFAQTPAEVSYSDDFQSYGTQANPPGWIDTSVGNPRPTAGGLYKTWPEPLDKNSPNIVYGTKQSSGRPEGNNPRIGTFTTLSTKTFSGQGRFEYRGRIIRTDADTRIGLTFFSSYPEVDRYYLLGLWSQPSSGNLTMQLFGFGGGTPSGTIDSNVSLTPNQWVRFVIQVEDANNQTRIRARFWPDGQAEPTTYAIDAIDSSATRLTSGRIGFWSAVKGDAYIDDLFAKSPVDHNAPTIAIFESGNPLADGSKFNRNAIPEIRVTDDLSTFTYSATLDGVPYTSLTPVAAEGWHTLVVNAVDGPGNTASQQVRFLVDKTPPLIAVLESGAPFPAGFFFRRDVVATANVTDISNVTVAATLDGNAYTLGTPIAAEGNHTLVVNATDEVAWTSTSGPIAFVIDKTPPTLTFTSHQNGALLTTPRAIVIGGSDDAVTVLVNGTAATVDTTAKTFTTAELSLLEGENTIAATGTDRAGNVGSATLKLNVDTRAPELTIASPAADTCVDATTLTVSGTVSDPRIDSVKVTIGAQSVTATLTGNAWTASVPVEEGRALITVEARDQSAHTTSLSRNVVVDRTVPAIEVTHGGQPFTATLVNRPVTLFVRAADADASVVLTATLDSAAYSSGTPIAGEGAHTLVVKATDCAGHVSEKTFAFTIDLTPPGIRELVPANGGTVGTLPSSIAGRTDADAATIVVEGTNLNATISGDAFTIASVPFAEGTNRFALVATDRAGNRASFEYSVIVRTANPAVEILESGLPIANGTLYNRAVTPVVRVAGGVQATIAATLNGASFTSGTTIANDGQYTIAATATDDLGHTGNAQATFSIDRTPPVVQIASPADGASIQSDRVEVRGSVGDATAALINGTTLPIGAGGSFAFEMPLDYGPNPIVVTAHDAAGNSGRATITVTRDDRGTGIIVTYPPDHSLTNRPTTDVLGRLLSVGRGTTVTVGSRSVEVDPTGAFRVSGYALTEGENSITATATATNGLVSAATTHVTADFTPPSLTILESNQPLVDSARFATQAVLTLAASDSGGGPVTTELIVDGTLQTATPVTLTAAGGHSVVATAHDRAGNQARSERMLFIGASTSGAECGLEGFDPADNAVVLSTRTTLVGRSGGAIGVKVNGIAAVVADGGFSANVELPNEGPNVVTIACTDAAGAPTGTPSTLTLQRVTGEPSIAITSPNEGFVSAQETITVTGTISAGIVNADVNGTPAIITGSNFTAAGVRLSDGLNVVVAHGRNAAGRTATASRRGTYEKDAAAITITTPTANATTGSNRITVGGTYTNLERDTIVVTNASSGQSVSATSVPFSDTTGSFTAADVPLTGGEQTLRVSGRDRLNRQVTASVVVKLVAGSPSIVITSPANQSYFPGGSTTFSVTGTFAGAAGSTVDVNGSAATISGNSYSATATFSTLITPVVARVTEPSGASAAATVFVTQLTDAPRVVESFPANDANEVDAGALLLVLFSQPMDAATLHGGAFRLEDATGAPVSGTLFVDKDVLTFAPATLLSGGVRYTMRVSTAAKNLAGTSLGAAFASSFTVASSAPSAAPIVDPLGAAVCGQSITVSGTAAPAARVRLDSGALVLTTGADTNGRFSFTYPLSGQSGFTLVRVRTVGSDGSLSPAAELTVRVDCSGPQVLNATFDRTTNALAISFSEAIDPSTISVGSSIVLSLSDGSSVGGTAAVAQNNVTVTPASDLRQKTFTLTVGTQVEDTTGNRLTTPYSQEFAAGGGTPESGNGAGFISGEVYDATTGRPLPGASIAVDVASPTPITTTTDARGRYLARLPEGAHTIRASHAGHTTVWREIIVPAGAGVIPIDIRLTLRGGAKSANGSALALTHGGDTAVTKKVELTIPSLASGASVSLTSVGAQALTGLLPLGWSPYASAEIEVDGATSLSAATLTFHTTAGEVATAAQNLAAVRYDSARDEWRVLQAVVNVAGDGRASIAIDAPGSYALVYADKAPGLTAPALPVAGDVLQGVPAAPTTAPPLVDHDFILDPPIVLPTGRTVATLRIEGAGDAKFPSGTAVQAYIDEDLRLADGSRLLDPPFATDLLLYRNLSGDLGIADFHLAPSAKAAQVVLEVGFEHIRVLPYPGRLDRGTLIGSEGGRVPADDKVAVEIPTGAVPEPLRATATSLNASDLAAIGSVPGFRVVGGFQLTLQRATQPAPQDLDGDGQTDAIPAVELFVPARATFSVDASKMPAPGAQVILAELLNDTPYGRMLRLAAPMMAVDGTATPVIRVTTRSIDRSVLPVDGVIREGRYVVLAAEAPIAFATGTLHLRELTGRLLSDARIIAPPLGVFDLTRTDGIYTIAVPARPAAPFSLVPRHTSTGDGAAYTHTAQVDPDSVTRVDLALVPQPPLLGNVVVLRGDPPSQAVLSTSAITRDVALTTNIRASFTPAIDPASVTNDSIVVTDAATGTKMSGRATADGSIGVVWTLTAGELLKANGRYLVTISSAIRGANGAALGNGVTYTFTTVTQVLNTEVHRERIRITIPDGQGVSRVTGDPGALPAGWQAVVVRRGRDFVVRYQATAASDGSFAFFIGNGDARDKVTMADLIDLRVVSNIGNLAAIFPLTPFVTADGRGFVAPPEEAVRFTSPDGVTIDVPAGAFDAPTIVTVNKATPAAFADIPRIEDENEFAAGIQIDFEGYAKKPLDVEVPVPAGFNTAGKDFLLAWKGMSTRGPRLAVADLMRVSNGKFTTIPDEAQQSRKMSVLGLKAGTNRTLVGKDFRNYLTRLVQGGYFMVLDIRVPVGSSVGWAAMEGLQASYDIIWSTFWSYYTPYVHTFEHSTVVIPVLTGVPFTVTGIDTATGLTAFSRTYDPLPTGPPFTTVPIPSAQQNDGGPYPVFGTPFRVEVLDLDVEDIDIPTIRNFVVTLENGNVTVGPSSDALDSNTTVELLNVTKGTQRTGTATSNMTLAASPGDRIVLLIEKEQVDPALPLSVAFNEAIFTGDSSDEEAVDTFLHSVLKLEQAPAPSFGSPSFTDITAQARFTTDSGGRRINIALPSALQRGAVYRLTLKSTIADVTSEGAGLTLGQGTILQNGSLTPVGGGNELHLTFRVREPAGEVGSFVASDVGLIRGMELYGNTLFVSAMNGGLKAFDVSNPAAISGTAPLLGALPGGPDSSNNYSALTIDRHGRIITTVEGPVLGALRTYRVEDFVNGTVTPASAKASSVINWRLGYSSMIGLPSNTILSDRPESIPYKVRVVLQDIEDEFADRQEFMEAVGATETGSYPDDVKRLTVSLPHESDYNYERITVENVTLDMRWSADAAIGGSATISNILARSTDRLRLIRNQGTYAVVAHLGYGIGVYDLNAMESNRHPSTTAATRMREQLFLGNGIVGRECNLNPPTWAIGENYLNLDLAVRGDAQTGDLYVYAMHPSKGVLDYRIHLPGSASGQWSNDSTCDQRGPTGLVLRSFPDGNEVPRMTALRAAISGAGGAPYAHFMSMAQYTWSIEAKDNAKGLRGSIPGSDARREYMLLAGLDYGVIVVELVGNPPTGPYFPLTDAHVADVLWVPGGAAGVRVIQEANVAVVTDRSGRVVLFDLSRIDERWDADGNPTTGLFPTAKKAIAGASTGAGEIGADDPRIIWKSPPGITGGALPPVFDPLTGIVYGSHQAARTVKALSAIDPTVRLKVNLGEGYGLSDVGGVVPLGIAPPQNIQTFIDSLPSCGDDAVAHCKENASLGAFRFEIALPGGLLSELGSSNNELWIAVESERIAGAVTEQTPDGFPRSHLRRTRRDGSPESSDRIPTNFRMRRAIPEEIAAGYKQQRGYNRFLSPWIIAIADPRASREYQWSGAATAQEKADAGCFACERPKHLKDLTENDGVYELWTNGRFISVRPELRNSNGDTIFDGTQYEYLGQQNRLVNRFSTVMADWVRPTEVLVAAQSAPVATGALQEAIFLHSGELETGSSDLDVGGRAGFNVEVARTYRSRTLGGGAFGQGWDSALFRRLRALPNGDVEYRDGAEQWLFILGPSGTYESPLGLYLKLARTARGWALIDQQWRVTHFDDLGRLLSDGDEFFDPQTPDSGNTIRYVYDESGRLSQIVDPVKRPTKITYWQESEANAEGAYPGLVKNIRDWRDRELDFRYDASTGTLTKVMLPEVANTTGGRPTVTYAYTPAGNSFNDKLELRTNLVKIIDPAEGGAGTPRLTFAYDTGSGFQRDRLKSETWGTGETVTFDYASATSVSTEDVLKQKRTYTLTAQPKDYFGDRAHIEKLVEQDVTTSATPFGQLPASVTPGIPATTSASRTFSFSFHPEGMVQTATLEGVRSTTYSYVSMMPEAPGYLPSGVSTSAAGGPSAPLSHTLNYQSGPNQSTFVASMSVNGQKIEAPEPNRNQKTVQGSNDSIQETEEYDSAGLFRKAVSSGGTDASSAGSETKADYEDADDGAMYRRSTIKSLDQGGLKTQFQYPDQNTIVQVDPRGVTTTTTYDSWRRPVHVTITGADMATDDRFEYDATGRIRKHVRKQGSADVTTTYEYDVMGRTKTVTETNVANVGTAATSMTYDLGGRTMTVTHPGGAVTTTTLDGIGRVASQITSTGGSPISDYFAYDLDDNLVFRSDLQNASATAYDANGRVIGSASSDGTRTTAEVDVFGNPTFVKTVGSDGSTIAESTLGYTSGGRLSSMAQKISNDQTRTATFAWDGAGRDTGMSEDGRAMHASFDKAGRLLGRAVGTGTATQVTNAFERIDVSTHDGALPQTLLRREKGGGLYSMALEYNAAADVITEALGNLTWKSAFDQAGNMTSSTAPGRGTATFQYDSRGSLTSETLPGGGTRSYDYTPIGALTRFADPSNEVTETQNDLVGRPTLRTYKDGTTEAIAWEGRRVKSITDRQGRTQTFEYNGKGQIAQISGPSGVLDKIEYDGAGHITKWTSGESVTEYADFDFEGRPRQTTQSRFRNGSLVDRYTQSHTWNAQGERTTWTMPSYSGFNPSSPWTATVTQHFDDLGNLVRMERTAVGGSFSGGALYEADYRNAGRPERRVVRTAEGREITRTYAYDAASGFLGRLSVTTGGRTIAGSIVTFDGLQKESAQLIGVSGGARVDRWSYDGRSRLAGSAIARDRGATPSAEDVTPGDFRSSIMRLPSTPVDPGSVTFEEGANGGHKIAVVHRNGITEQFLYNGGERIEDGQFKYAYDDKGRLTVVTQKRSPSNVMPLRRVVYAYDGNDRIVGRRAEYAPLLPNVEPGPGDWRLEDRDVVIATDVLPPEVTLVWDPISDRLVSIFKTGASENPRIDDNGGLVRQILHAGQDYDDPIEVETASPWGPRSVEYLYPIYDEAGGHTLQVILNAAAEIVSRSSTAGPYGENESVLLGAAVDKVSIEAKRDTAGQVTEVRVKLRSTEDILASTLAAGVRLAVVTASGQIVRTSPVAPALDGAATAAWTLTEAEWTALVDPTPVIVNGQTLTPAALSVAATKDLRAAAWSTTLPFVAAPQWARATKPVFATVDTPVDVRESLANLSQWLASLPPDDETKTSTLYEIPSLYALSVIRTSYPALIVGAGFHAQPFQDPLTGKNFVRARWFDVETGTWLTPDPLGYRDSANLYAYCGNDPVNCTDPTGQISWDEAWAFTKGAATNFAIGVGTTIVVAGTAAALGISAPVVIAAGAVVAVGAVAYNGYKRYEAGHADTVWGAAGLGVADVTGLTGAFEAYTGQEVGTGRDLSRIERAERAGGAFGNVATMFVAPGAARFVSRRVPNLRAPRGTGAPTTSAGGGGPGATMASREAAAGAPRVNPRHVRQAQSVQELDTLLRRLGARAVREAQRARANGMSGQAAGNQGDAVFTRYAQALNNRLAAQNSRYVAEIQPARLAGVGRIPSRPYERGSLRLDIGLSDRTLLVTNNRGQQFPTLLRGYDITINARKINATLKYQGPFGIPIIDIR